jgi:hypothetical protein
MAASQGAAIWVWVASFGFALRADLRADQRADLSVDLSVDEQAGLHPALGDGALAGLLLVEDAVGN